MFSKRGSLETVYDVASLGWRVSSGLYYKSFMIIIYERNAIGQYYKTTIVVNGQLRS